jgi:hypothetical protein
MQYFIGSPHRHTMPILFADGSTRPIPYQLNPMTSVRLWSWNDGSPPEDDLTAAASQLGNYQTTITLARPLWRQVIQRGNDNFANVKVEGQIEGPVTSIEARATVMTGGEGTPTDWQLIAGMSNIGGRRFRGSLRLRAGGWYVLEIRALVGNQVVASTKIEKIGVGEVFITAGQSNSANHGAGRQAPMDDRVSAWTGTEWKLAVDPQPLCTGTDGSPWPLLGDALVQKLRVPVAFASVGFGGSPVQQWHPDGELYPRIRSVLRALGAEQVRGVLWHQGEHDTANRTSAGEYASRLNAVIEASRVDGGQNLWWFVAGVAYVYPTTRAYEAEVRAGQARVCDGERTFAGPTTDDLLGIYRRDGVHFSEIGLREHARRWAEVLTRQLADRENSRSQLRD